MMAARMMNDGMMGGGAGFLIGLLGLLLFLAIIGGAAILVAYLAAGAALKRAGKVPGPGSSGKSAALIELESRYARGELNRDEFIEKKQDLG